MKWLVLCICFYIFTPTILSSNRFVDNIPQIGAYYFGGWAGYSNSKENWAKNAPYNATKKLITEYKDRKPIWGWKDDTPEIMQKQIKLAVENGIDFFSFCWYWCDNNMDINEDRIKSHPLHKDLYLFMNESSNKKVKFNLLIANHKGSIIKNKEMWIKAIDFWCKNYFNHPNYLKINNSPVVNIFDGREINKLIPELKLYVKQKYNFNDIIFISNNYNRTDNNFDLISWYNIREEEPGFRSIRDYSQLLNRVRKVWMARLPEIPIAPCVMVNWDMRPWEKNVEGIYYINRTPEQFEQQLKDAFIISNKEKNKLIFIYAWNELGEGGYLIPTQGDKNYKYLKVIQKVKSDFIKKFKYENSVYQY